MLKVSPEDRIILVNYTVAFEGGKKNPFGAMNLDKEYEGYFDQPRTVTRKGKRVSLTPLERSKQPNHKPHRASKYGNDPFHIGLSYGAWQAAQEPGSLGKLLRYMQKENPDLFHKVFQYPDEILAVTNAKGGRVGSRSPRTQPVHGADLWEEPWVDRFETAGVHTDFQRAQGLWVADNYLDPALRVCEDVGLETAADLAVAFDIAIQFGVGGLKSRASKVPKGKWSLKKLEGLIKALPASHRPRREKIAALAGHEKHFV